MTYFNKFPVLNYPLETYISAIKDITFRVKFKTEVLDNYLFYDYYQIKDGENAELISYAVYGSTMYHWIILMVNDIIDPYLDWPMPQNVFTTWVEEKYSHLNSTTEEDELSLGADKVKYWINEDGIVVPEEQGTFPISHRMFEEILNNQKRNIKIVKTELLSDIINQFEELLNK